jgi:hypothetical protein
MHVYNFILEELTDTNAKEEVQSCAMDPTHVFINFENKPTRFVIFSTIITPEC